MNHSDQIFSADKSAMKNAHVYTTIALCFLVALLEGFDLQVAGIAAAGLRNAFQLESSMLGAVFSAGIVGLLPGALAGGWLADRYGRKTVLMGAVFIFGLFSVATAFAWDFNTLVLARFLTGVGLGAAMPNLIALPAEAAGPKLKGTAISLMYCGVPLGAAIAAIIGMNLDANDWKSVFIIGGVVPILVIPLLAFFLKESSDFRKIKEMAHENIQPPRLSKALFGRDTRFNTAMLWVSYFFTLLVMYMLINWLPTLITSQGFTGKEAGKVLLSMQIGGTLGSVLLGVLMDRWKTLPLFLVAYTGILIALVILGSSSNLNHLLIGGFLAGFFVLGCQLMLYTLAPHYYPTKIRATGVGSAVAVGRIGAMAGPLVAGYLLTAGFGAVGVFLGVTPGIAIAIVAIVLLVRRSGRQN